MRKKKKYMFFTRHLKLRTMIEARKSHVRAAVTQAEPVWLDLEVTVGKTCRLIAERPGMGQRWSLSLNAGFVVTQLGFGKATSGYGPREDY